MTAQMKAGFLAMVSSVLATGLVMSAELSEAQSPQQKKPNIVFILVDNVGWGTFGVYGGSSRNMIAASNNTPTSKLARTSRAIVCCRSARIWRSHDLSNSWTSCAIDEGGPPEIGFQEQVSNHLQAAAVKSRGGFRIAQDK
jgi:hypothetical protein